MAAFRALLSCSLLKSSEAHTPKLTENTHRTISWFGFFAGELQISIAVALSSVSEEDVDAVSCREISSLFRGFKRINARVSTCNKQDHTFAAAFLILPFFLVPSLQLGFLLEVNFEQNFEELPSK